MQNIKITDFYDEFRPYNETETKEAILRIIQDNRFFQILQFFFPEYSTEEYLKLMHSVKSVHDFQIKVMQKILNQILESSSAGISYSGIDSIERTKNYVYISNHRDIILDATLFQNILVKENFPTTEITFGSNLMKDKLIYELGKINKMFKVYRKGSPKELLKKTLQLSEYIRYTIFNKKQSIWIAQRGGRTKDGFDKTQTGIIKMLNSSGTKTFEENIKEINIIPISISYEFEPNDHLKVNELLHTVNGKYEKSENEDINSIIDGICSQKGRIHLSFGQLLNTELDELNLVSRTNEKVNKIAEIIDKQIYKNFKLWPNNYIAADLLNKNKAFSSFYTNSEQQIFANYKKEQLLKIKNNSPEAEDLFLQIYANPVFNYNKK